MTVGELKNFLDLLDDKIIVVVVSTDDPDVLWDIQLREKNIDLVSRRPVNQYKKEFSGMDGLIISPGR